MLRAGALNREPPQSRDFFSLLFEDEIIKVVPAWKGIGRIIPPGQEMHFQGQGPQLNSQDLRPLSQLVSESRKTYRALPVLCSGFPLAACFTHVVYTCQGYSLNSFQPVRPLLCP